MITSADLTEKGSWTVRISNIPAWEGNEEIVYTWKEEEVEGYTQTALKTTGNMTTMTNTHEPQYVESTVSITWDDRDDRRGLRPKSVHVKLSNGTRVELNAECGWTATVKNLPKHKNGKEVVYTWTQEDALGYQLTNTDTTGGGYTFTDTLKTTGGGGGGGVRRPTTTPDPAVGGASGCGNVGDTFD